MGTVTSNGRLTRPSAQGEVSGLAAFWRWLKGLVNSRNGDSNLRETFEEIIEEYGEEEGEEDSGPRIGDDERVMLSNILNLRRLTAYDVMVPRADIVASEMSAPIDQLIELMSKGGHSRVPVYRGTLDETVGLVHIKDVVDYVRQNRPFEVADILRRVLIVAPSMRVIDLLLEMRQSRVHMALVVDEFGGIDGLITIEDLVEEIVGEIDDEHDVLEGPKLERRGDGTMIADARATIEEFEELLGPVLSEEEREEDIDTLGGLLVTLAGRVPLRGEVIEHKSSGITFEVLEADPRRVKRVRLRNPPAPSDAGLDPSV